MRADSRLTDRCPWPDSIEPRLRSQLDFVLECDRLKTVVRRSPLAATDRRENDAEHSWHLALMTIVLAEHSDEPIDVGRTVMLVVVHDLVEIYAGDTPVFGAAGRDAQAEREAAAAERLFTQLPADQAGTMRGLWEEFEAGQSPESRFARAMDRLEPQLLNWFAGGGTWQGPGVVAADEQARRVGITAASAALGRASGVIIDTAAQRGWIDAG